MNGIHYLPVPHSGLKPYKNLLQNYLTKIVDHSHAQYKLAVEKKAPRVLSNKF